MKNQYERQRQAIKLMSENRSRQLHEGGPGSGRRPGVGGGIGRYPETPHMKAMRAGNLAAKADRRDSGGFIARQKSFNPRTKLGQARYALALQHIEKISKAVKAGKIPKGMVISMSRPKGSAKTIMKKVSPVYGGTRAF
jgi:hypothetical protein